MQVRSTITASFDNAGVRAMVDGKARDAATAAARAGAQEARAVASTRKKTGAMSAIAVEPVRRSRRGFVASFVSPVKHAWYQNDGTLGNRREDRPLRSPVSGKRSRAPGTGVTPLLFLDRGLEAGRAILYAVARR